MKRVLSAAVFLPVFWVIVKFRPETYEILIAVAALLALRELFRLASASGQRCHQFLGTLVTLLVIASFAFTRFDIRYALTFEPRCDFFLAVTAGDRVERCDGGFRSIDK